jgi:hypothetical protein
LKAYKKVFATLIIIMVFLGTTAVLLPRLVPPFTGWTELTADKLAEKPEKYFEVINAEPILLEAIASGHVRCSTSDTQIDDLASQYNTNNIEYKSEYYSVGFVCVEAIGWSNEMMLAYNLSICGFMVSLTLLISTVLVKGGLDRRKRAGDLKSSGKE